MGVVFGVLYACTSIYFCQGNPQIPGKKLQALVYDGFKLPGTAFPGHNTPAEPLWDEKRKKRRAWLGKQWTSRVDMPNPQQGSCLLLNFSCTNTFLRGFIIHLSIQQGVFF